MYVDIKASDVYSLADMKQDLAMLKLEGKKADSGVAKNLVRKNRKSRNKVQMLPLTPDTPPPMTHDSCHGFEGNCGRVADLLIAKTNRRDIPGLLGISRYEMDRHIETITRQLCD